MRIRNAQTKNKIWNVLIVRNDENILNKDFTTLKEIAIELGLTYNQVAELGEKNGRVKQKQAKFKFYPQITIKRIKPTQKEYYKQKTFLKECLKLGGMEIY